MKKILFSLLLLATVNLSIAQLPSVPITIKNTTSVTMYIELQPIINCIFGGMGPTIPIPPSSTFNLPAPAGGQWWYRMRIHDNSPPVITCYNHIIKAPYWTCSPEPSVIPTTMTCYGVPVTVTWTGPASAPLISIF